MRKIKFRGKRTDTGEWVFGDLIHREAAPKSISNVQVNGCGVIPETVGQFTGLLDKNGSDIYEHDIVTWTDSDGRYRIDVVKWMNGGLCLCNNRYTVGSYGYLEVIGNVVDNPELLKGGKE